MLMAPLEELTVGLDIYEALRGLVFREQGFPTQIDRPTTESIREHGAGSEIRGESLQFDPGDAIGNASKIGWSFVELENVLDRTRDLSATLDEDDGSFPHRRPIVRRCGGRVQRSCQKWDQPVRNRFHAFQRGASCRIGQRLIQLECQEGPWIDTVHDERRRVSLPSFSRQGFQQRIAAPARPVSEEIG